MNDPQQVYHDWQEKQLAKFGEFGMHTKQELHNFSCDAFDCKAKITRGGDINIIHEELYELGWSFGEVILGRKPMDFCPDCCKQIAQFLFKEDR